MKKAVIFPIFLFQFYSVFGQTPTVDLTVDKSEACYTGGNQIINLTATVSNPPSSYPYNVIFYEVDNNGTDIEETITVNNAGEVKSTYSFGETFQQFNHEYYVQLRTGGDGFIAGSDTFPLTVYQQATVTVNKTQPIVLSKSASPIALASLLSITHATGVTPTFSTTFSGTGVTGGTHFDPFVAPIGEHYVTYEVRDQGECPVSGTIHFAVAEDVTLTINGSNEICRIQGSPVTVQFEVSEPTAIDGVSYRYKFYKVKNGTTTEIPESSPTPSSNTLTYTIPNTENGSFQFYAEVESSSNSGSWTLYSTTANISLNVYRTPVATVNDPPSPLEKNAPEIDLESSDFVDVSYPASGYDIDFEPHDGLSGSWFFPVNVESGTHEVYLTIRDDNDNAGICAIKDTIKIVVLAEPELSPFLSYLENPPVCESYESFLLSATIDTSCLNFEDFIYYFPLIGPVTLRLPPDTIHFSADYIAEPTNVIAVRQSFNLPEGVATYRLEINPSAHDIDNNYRITITPKVGNPGFKTGCTEYIGKIPIDPGGNPNILGLPVLDETKHEEAWICSASYDTLQMRGNPASGRYNFYLGYIDDFGTFQPTDTLPADSTISHFESPPGERTLVKIVPAELLSIYDQGYGLNTAIQVDYTYPLFGSCPETTSKFIRFRPGIDLGIKQSLETAFCYGDTVNLSVDYSNYTYGVNDKFSWNFGDGFSTVFESDTVVSHFYKDPGMYRFQFKTQMETITPDTACNIHIIDTIYIGAQPIADFDVYKNFKDSASLFSSTSSLIIENISDAKDTISTWQWLFGNSSGDSHISTIRGDTTFTYTELSKEPYEATLTVTSGWGCQATKTRSIPVFPVKTPLPLVPVTEAFDPVSVNGWFESGSYKDLDTLSSWKNILPAGNTITELPGEGEAWITSENPSPTSGYYRNESSWVESPVFDITNLQLPMVSLNSWTNLDLLFDGASVQYAVVDDSAFGKEEWITLGAMNEGLGWYNSQTIIGEPGGDFKGWTGDTAKSWQLSAYKLNHILDSLSKYDNKLIRFRIVLGTNNDNMPGKTFDGFAFDNFFVGERNRKVIVEEFCDYDNFETSLDEVFRDPQAIRIQYHVSAENSDDVINQANKADPSARALTYGIGKNIPTGVVDGIYQNNQKGLLEDQWGENAFLRRSLMVSPFQITVTPAVVNGKLEINSTIHRLTDEITGPFIVHVAVVEKAVTANGQYFTNVLRSLLPNAAGTRVSANETWASPIEINQTWQPLTQPESGLMAIVFIQDEMTREIYQSNYDSIPFTEAGNLVPVPNKAGSAFVAEPAFTEIFLAPNPTGGDLKVTFNGIVNQPLSYSIVNQIGQVMQSGSIGKNFNFTIINTDQLGSGMYSLVLNTEYGKMIEQFAVVK